MCTISIFLTISNYMFTIKRITQREIPSSQNPRKSRFTTEKIPMPTSIQDDGGGGQ